MSSEIYGTEYLSIEYSIQCIVGISHWNRENIMFTMLNSCMAAEYCQFGLKDS